MVREGSKIQNSLYDVITLLKGEIQNGLYPVITLLKRKGFMFSFPPPQPMYTDALESSVGQGINSSCLWKGWIVDFLLVCNLTFLS